MSASVISSRISLFEAAFPRFDSKEGTIFFESLKTPKKGKPTYFHQQYRCNLVLAKLMLEICQETAMAVEKGKYKQFDALVRNFGCQITALQNYRIIRSAELRNEARHVHSAAAEQLKMIASLWKSPPAGENDMGFTAYLKQIGIDVQLSPAMAQLVRFKILNIINTNILSGGIEVPKTDTDQLYIRVNEIVQNFNLSNASYSMPNVIRYARWIDGLQAEESREAIIYIQKIGLELVKKGGDARAPLINKMLDDQYVRASNVRGSASTPIVSLSQLYTGEVALKAVEGIVMIKNKTTLAGQAIPDAKPMQAYFKMPEGILLSEEQIKSVADNEPIVVLEGFIPQGTQLEKEVQKVGMLRLLNATLARLPSQYATGIDGDFAKMHIDSQEAQADLELFKTDEAYNIMRVDHMYCASMQEER